ncbi:GerAB/ArcD/ProY family transporter [Geobacillus thermodenitrificans]|uniref:GerAB/ArcD/ProY family transporter n=1 Tax=Geobacillus thermodenitrificans TaxID=33940 RepID=UPI00399C95A6
MENEKITSVQMMMLLYPAITTTAILLVPGVTAQHAQQDMWLSPIWASLIGFLTVHITVQLYRLYPKKHRLNIAWISLVRFSASSSACFCYFFIFMSPRLLSANTESLSSVTFCFARRLTL